MKRNYFNILADEIKHEQVLSIAPANKPVSKIKIGALLLLVLFFLVLLPQQIEAAQTPEESLNDVTNELLLKVSDASVEEIIRLIHEGADVNVIDIDSLIPLTIEEIVRIGNESESGNDLDKGEMTPLMYAAKSNPNPEVIRVLIENGADVKAATKIGWTPFMYAAMSNSNPEVLRVLIENGADVNAVTRVRATPLIYAVKYNSNPDIIRVLIENGADVDIVDSRNRNMLYYAVTGKFYDIQYSKYNMVSRVSEDIDFNLYHPWSSKAQLSKLDSPTSLLIRGDYPKLDGATLAYPIYAALANEIYAVSEKSELQQYLTCSKTSEAYTRLINGETDVIFVLQPSDEQLQSAKDAGVELHFTPLAKDAFVFLVNDGNPVSSLSIEQIRGIYLNTITNWQDVGGNNIEIAPYQRQENSGSQTTMIKEVMKGEKLPEPIKERISSGMTFIVLDVAASYPNHEWAIGYSFRFFTSEMMRSIFEDREKMADYFQLLLSLIPTSDPNSNEIHEYYQSKILGADDLKKNIKLLAVDGYAPNEENIRNGKYPFIVNLYAVTAGSSNPHIQELITWLLSPQGQELIEKTGFVGVKR